MAKRHPQPPPLFCPVCGSTGQKQPVLVPMHVRVISNPIGGEGHCYFSYRCQRAACLYGELHECSAENT